MRALALDLATHAGWASSSGGIVVSGAASFARRTTATKAHPVDHAGAGFARFQAWLAELLRIEKPDTVAYEEVCRWCGYSAAHAFGAYRGIMLAECARLGIPAYGYTPGAVKKYWTGNGAAKKPAMIAEALRRYPREENAPEMLDDEADALAILSLHLSRQK